MNPVFLFELIHTTVYLRADPDGSQPRVPVDLKNLKSCFWEQHAIPER